jgi:hypothetical protein
MGDNVKSIPEGFCSFKHLKLWEIMLNQFRRAIVMLYPT